MAYERIKPAKISDTIVRQIEQLLLEGILKPGDRLPPERDLARELKVSRPSLREAILKLEAKGLLQSRRGGGTYVVDVITPILTEPLVHLLKDHPETTFDILELRHALEEVAAYFAALRGTEADQTILRHRFSTLESLQEKHDTLRYAEADAEFHLAIADASHNIALTHVMRGLFNLLRHNIYRSLEKLHTQEGNLELIEAQHRQILSAVLDRNPEAARQAAHLHLAFVEKTLRELNLEETREERSQRRLRNLLDSQTD